MRIYAATWQAALASFVVAGATGALLRLCMSYGWDPGVPFDHLRHAHSHLMYFGWGTPALMALIAARLPAHGAEPMPPRVKWLLGGLLVAAFATWPLFLLYGYQPVPIGAARVPPAVVASGINILFWYAYAALYVRATRGVRRTRALRLWDLALGFLLLSTLGAWGIAVRKPLGVEDPRAATALIHLFLDVFSQGWFVLAVLGLAWDALAPRASGRHWTHVLLLVGTPLTFVLALRPADVPEWLRLAALVSGAAVGTALLAQLRALARRITRPWAIPLALLFAGACALLLVSVFPWIDWLGMLGLRVLYLHVVVLGFLTLGLFAAGERILGAGVVRGRIAMTAAALAVLLSLVPLSALWPGALGLRWAIDLAALVAPLPVLAALWGLSRSGAVLISSRGGTNGTSGTQGRDPGAVRGRS